METSTAETETFNGNHTTMDTESIDERMTPNIEVNSRRKNGKIKIVFCFSLLVIAAALIVVFGVYLNFSENTQPQPNHLTTQEFVEEITEDLLVCQQDVNCHEFNITSNEISKIKNAFNGYDGNSDNKWSKEEFIKYYIEVSKQNELFDTMDINNDGILSYKEIVLYLLNIKDQPFINDTLTPIYDKLIPSIYKNNVTSNCQLYWEYIAEMFLYSFDDTQEGYIKKDNYLSKFGEIEFGLITLNETSDEYITFDKFMEFEFNSNSVQKAVNDDVLDVAEIDLTKHTMQNLHLQHQLYEGNVFTDGNRRRLFTSQEYGCLTSVSQCTGSSLGTIYNCVLIGERWNKKTFGEALDSCIGGRLPSRSTCWQAKSMCGPVVGLLGYYW